MTEAQVKPVRVGNRTRTTATWQRAYGTIFSGPLVPGTRPAAAPDDGETVQDAVSSWATGRPPGTPYAARCP